MTTDELLQAKRPEQVFSGDPDRAKKQYHALARQWHPDSNPDNPAADTVFQHITVLYQTAVERIRAGTWEGAGSLQVVDRRGLIHPIQYLRSHACELGRQYIGTDHLTIVADPAYKDLVLNGLVMTERFNYASSSMKDNIAKFLPSGVTDLSLQDGRVVLQTPKAADLLMLRHVLESYGGVMPARHVAWILSRLYNMACYLSYAGLVHHHISPDTCFIVPKLHSVALLGGWYYARRDGAPLALVPKRTFEYLPWTVRTAKRAVLLTDQELIRATGRELLGDLSGATLKEQAPTPMIKWLKSVATGDAVREFRDWNQVLTASYGPRKFVLMDVSAKTLYQSQGGL